MATILLVEDDTLLADCYRAWLRAMGHKVQHATDVISALDMFDSGLPDVILLDMLLPGGNGVQLLHLLNSHADLKNVPVVICSNASMPDAAELRAYGVCAVLEKPTLTRRSLATTIDGVLQSA